MATREVESDEDEICQERVLPVADFDNFDPSKPPVSGEEYLRRVQLEAKQCPAIVVADIQSSKFDENRVQISTSSESKHSLSLLPAHIQEVIADDFNQLQKRLDRLRLTVTQESLPFTSKLPEASDYKAWTTVCLGNLDESVVKKCDSLSAIVGGIQSNYNSPNDSALLAMSQEDLLKLLEYQLRWIPQYGFHKQNALWIYSILSCLQCPLNGDTYFLLRDVARAIIKQIHSSHNLPEPSISANLIICIIARCFNQRDLIDD